MSGRAEGICSLDLNERELNWVGDGIEMVLDGLRDQLTSEAASTPDWESAKAAVDEAEALRDRVQFHLEGGESA